MSEILKEITNSLAARMAKKHLQDMSSPNGLMCKLLENRPEELADYKKNCEVIKDASENLTPQEALTVLKAMNQT